VDDSAGRMRCARIEHLQVRVGVIPREVGQVMRVNGVPRVKLEGVDLASVQVDHRARSPDGVEEVFLPDVRWMGVPERSRPGSLQSRTEPAVSRPDRDRSQHVAVGQAAGREGCDGDIVRADQLGGPQVERVPVLSSVVVLHTVDDRSHREGAIEK